MFAGNGLWGVAVFVGIYLVILWVASRFVIAKVNSVAREVGDALQKAGARVLATRPTKNVWHRAEVDFELGGTRATAAAQQWGRDARLVTLRVPTRPRPALWLRRERGIDRMAKAVGFEREVQTGDAEFDAAAYIAARAPDNVVRDLLAPPEVRRLVTEILQRGYSVFVSREGLRAAVLTGFWSGFDESGLASMLDLLKQLDAALPVTDASLAGEFQPPRSPVAVILPAMMASMLAIVVFGVAGRDLVHAPNDGGAVLLALLGGLVLWFPAVYLAARKLRDRPFGLFELILVAIALLTAIPFVGAFGLFALNSGLDHAPATHQRARVVQYYERNRHTVWVQSDTPGATRDKLIVPRELGVISIGDTFEYDRHPGALGWQWITGIRRAE